MRLWNDVVCIEQQRLLKIDQRLDCEEEQNAIHLPSSVDRAPLRDEEFDGSLIHQESEFPLTNRPSISAMPDRPHCEKYRCDNDSKSNRISNLFTAKDRFLLSFSLYLLLHTWRHCHREKSEDSHHGEQRHERVTTLGSPRCRPKQVARRTPQQGISNHIYCGRRLGQGSSEGSSWFVIFRINSRCRTMSKGLHSYHLRHRSGVFDLQTGIRQHQFFLGDAGHTKSTTKNIAAINRQHVLIVLVLHQRRIGQSIRRTDNADVAVVGHRRRSYLDGQRVRVKDCYRACARLSSAFPERQSMKH